MIRLLAHGLIAFIAFVASFGAPAVEPARHADSKLLDAFLKPDNFNRIKLSPDGTYIAISVPIGDRTILSMMRRSDMKLMGTFNMRGKTHVADFWWVSNTRIVLSIAEKDGPLEQPVLTGEMFATDVDGGKQTILTGYRSGEMQTGSHLHKRDDAWVWSRFVARIPGTNDEILAAVTYPNDLGVAATTSLERVNVNTGFRRKVTTSQLAWADFVVDHQARPRFAYGESDAGFLRLYYRDADGNDWQLINDEVTSKQRATPIGFNKDDSLAYLLIDEPEGPSSIYAMDVATGKRERVVRDPRVDPDGEDIILGHDGQTPIAVVFRDGKPRISYLDEQAPEAQFLKSLQDSSFPDEAVEFVNATEDGKLLLFRAYSDTDPGSYYLLNTETKKAEFLVANMDWLNSAALATVKPFEFKARDGMTITGLLTLPHGHAEGAMPMIVNPHGGPYGITDHWGFNGEAQLLAAHGFVVLQVNFRGSGNRGRSFEIAGHGQWGAAMQDDVTDATHWAIDQGYADPHRICIYGGSYGGYAALYGAAREPALYQCAVGYVGVYDLVSLVNQNNIRASNADTNFYDHVLGKDNALLASRSPINLADKIRVPVFLASGGTDQRVDKSQSEDMRARLIKAGNVPQWLAYPTEGHGFYTQEHRTEFYRQLIDFLYLHTGGDAAAANATGQ